MASTKAMNWIIVGAHGQLGKTLTSSLAERGVDYYALGHSDLDVTDAESVAKIERLDPGMIVNCAGWTDVEAAEVNEEAANRVNGDGPARLAVLAKSLEIPFIHISTDYVFSGLGDKPWRTDDRTEPTSTYGRSKLLGEQRATSIYKEGALVLRTAWLYSEHGRNFAKTILRKALTSKDEIRVVGDQFGQPTTTYDLVNRIIQIGTHKIPSGIYHAVNSGCASWWDLAVELVAKAGLSSDRVLKIDSGEFKTKVERPKYSVLDLSGWKEVGFEPMQDWRAALDFAFPKIMSAVKAESSNG